MIYIYISISQSGQYPGYPGGGAMKVTSLNNFLLSTYVPVHFFMIGERLSFFLQVGGKDKSLGITDIY